MPRINIEDSLFCDDRFMRLIESTGDRVQAIGSLLLAYKIAQKHWLPDHHRIPNDEWKTIPNHTRIVECGLAEIGEDGVYVKGTEACSQWWFDAREKGRRGGLAKASRAKALVEHTVEPSVPSSSSSSSSSYKKEKGKGDARGKRAKALPTTLLEVLESYKSKYHPDFLTQQFEICREYHYANSGIEPTLAHVGYWLRNDIGQKNWAKFELDHGIKQDPMIEYFQKLTDEEMGKRNVQP